MAHCVGDNPIERLAVDSPSRKPTDAWFADDTRRIPFVRTSLGVDRGLPVSCADWQSEGVRENSRTQPAMQGGLGEDVQRETTNADVRQTLSRNDLLFG